MKRGLSILLFGFVLGRWRSPTRHRRGSLLRGQDDKSRRRFYFRRLLRPLVAPVSAPYAAIFTRKSRDSRAKHAGGRRADRGQSHV